ncbi:TetR/AcrR family transcriptional regulator [Nocardia vinacea]|uniref:TetR/AcrR family transcriptional regulator n=1 Tax=Nocardia vinacea TaxID=96468 RepID=UPI000688460F|nr:TetR/AcrR family transcriptional regulator [Nocardia vinacea]
MSRRPAWNGSPPRDDAEARERIIDAAMRCIDRHGARKATLSDVAAELGVIRQTVYRHFSSTEDLFAAVGYAAADGYLDRLLAHLAGITDPADLAVEAIAYTVERVPHDRYLGLLLSTGRPATFSRVAMGEAAFEACRTVLDRSDVDWAASGYTGDSLTEMIEYLLRILLSFAVDPMSGSRAGAELRRFLRRWIAPSIGVASQVAPAAVDEPASQGGHVITANS